ncbi:hypothetical protein M413DRAFT_32588 [Hebeloma cylindrosporum]|uniref:Protein kinase domain-containing protein n=1 Tax=Hebeloma cylindrosporum TaxID=76867 RepID=A0A0C3BTC0_HEBCY|nr:hypothetical protein M413DRAFT_32588 [Hebeloma cylindrosporum h7]
MSSQPYEEDRQASSQEDASSQQSYSQQSYSQQSYSQQSYSQQSQSQPQPVMFDANQETQDNILLNFQFFLDENPERTEAKPFGTKARTTRKPAFFDLHLHPELRLKKIVIIDDLAQQLAGTCDRHLQDGLRNLTTEQPVNEITALKDGTKSTAAANEETIARNYGNSSGKYCARIASTLLFGLKDFSEEILEWSTSPQAVQRHGKADGFLSVVRVPSKKGNDDDAETPAKAGQQTGVEPFSSEPDDKQSDPPTLPSEREDILEPSDESDIELIRKYDLQHVAVWEMKSLFAGDEVVMKEIGNLGLEDAFVWTLCGRPGAFEALSQDNGSDAQGVECGAVTKHMSDIRVSVTGRKTGPDDKATSEYWTSVKSPSRQKLKARANLTAQEKAHCIVQQAWAEAVMNDASFIIFHSGNLEYIGIRHRQSQTLYLSQLIKIPNEDLPGYYRIHAGLFIAAYKDALARAKLLHQWNIQSPRDENLYPLYSQNYDHDGNRYRGVKAQRKSLHDEKTDLELFMELDKANSFQITIPHGFHFKQIARPFIKLDINPDTDEAPRAPLAGKQSEVCPTLHLVAPTPFPGTLRVWDFDFLKKLPGTKNFQKHSKGLVVKLAKGPHEKKELYSEIAMYNKLDKVPEVRKYLPRIHGIFAFDFERETTNGLGETKIVPDTILAMVMRHGGESIPALLMNNENLDTVQLQKAAREALRKIHGEGYLLRTGLSPHNILIKNGNPSIRFINLRTWEKRPDAMTQSGSKRKRDSDFEEEVDELIRIFDSRPD